MLASSVTDLSLARNILSDLQNHPLRALNKPNSDESPSSREFAPNEGKPSNQVHSVSLLQRRSSRPARALARRTSLSKYQDSLPSQSSISQLRSNEE